MYRLSLLLLLICAYSQAWAQECRNIDLRQNGILGSIRDQQSLGWCFAYAAADMYSMALGRRVSPFDIAINHYRDNHSYAPSRDEDRLTRWKGGNQFKVFESAKAHGVCPDNVFSAYMPNSASLLAQLDNQLRVYKNITGQNRKDAMTRWLYPNYSRLYVLAPMTPSPRLRDMLTDVDLREFPLVGFADQLCDRKRITLGRAQLQSLVHGSVTENVKALRNTLNMGLPVAMGYDDESLKTLERGKKMNHISSIIASRKTDFGCEYLLRNSWGPFNSRAYHPLLRRWTDADFVWIPEEIVAEIAHELHRVTRK